MTKTIAWSSSDANIARVSSTGEVTGVAQGTVTITATCEGRNDDCEVTVEPAPVVPATITNITPTGPFSINPNSGNTLSGRAELRVTTNPENAEVHWVVVSASGTDSAESDVVRLAPSGKTCTVTGLKPGEAQIYAYVEDGTGANQQTNKVVVRVNGIDVDTTPIVVTENQTVDLPAVTPYGTAQGYKFVVNDNYIAQVVGGNKVKGYTPGKTTIIVSDQNGNYKTSIDLEVVSDPSTTITYTTSLRNGEALSFKKLSSDFASQLDGKVVSISGMNVPTNQGTLYYRYNAEAEPGAGVGNETYYRGSYVTGGRRDVEDITFVAKSDYVGGTVTISYIATTEDGDTVSCRILLEVIPENGANAGLSLTTKYNTPVQFSANEFDRVCKERTGSALSYVTFSLPNERQGTLYTNYSSADSYGSRVTLNTQYNLRNLGNIWFVPAPGYIGTVTVYYTGRSVGTPGVSYTGQIVITVGSDSASSIGGLAYNAAQGGAVTFDDADFNTYCQSITDSSQRLNYIRFTALPSTSEGTLYYDYRSANSPGTRVTAGTTYYYGTYTPRIDRVTFVPAEDYAGTVRIPFLGWTNSGVQFSGNVEINVRGGAGSGDIHYSCAAGKTVRFSVGDFTELCRNLTGRTLDYIRFQALPNSSDGVLYHNTSTRVNTTTSYRNATSGYRIANLSFQASSRFSGSVDIPFVGYASGSGESFSGVITIDANASGSVSSDIHYSTDYTSAAVFDRDDFDDLSLWETDRAVSTVRFSLPSSSQGDLYRNYRSSSSKGTKITSSTTSISASELDRVAFVPVSGYTGTVYLDFTARATNSEEFTGTVEIAVDRPPADVTVRYSTRTAPVTFREADFRKSGSTLSSIQFGSMPATSAGYMYYQYTSPTRYGRQASAGTTYRASGSNLISDLTFVPRAGFSGTVTIPYTGTNSNNSTFEGEVVITVSPSYSSAYFTDMGSYSDAQRAAVDYLRENGITNGISATQYGPEYSITRGDFAVMIYQAFGLNYVSSTGSFNDVPANIYYAQAVNTLHAMGIVSGIGNGAYGPSLTLTRQDAICMVQRAMRAVGWSASDGYSSYLTNYSDSNQVSGYAQGAMAYAVQRGYLPTTNGRLAPKDPLTRVDMAQIIHRVLTY